MHLADVVFPLNLHLLTYSVPEALVKELKEGMLVKAPLKGKERIGLVVKLYEGKSKDSPENLRPLKGVLTEMPLYPPSMIGLLNWISEYYISSEGTAFKCMFFNELVKGPARRPKRPKEPEQVELSLQSPESVNSLKRALKEERGYQCLLYMAKAKEEEFLLLAEVLRTKERALIMAPEIEDAELIFGYLHRLFLGDVCLYHSRMSLSGRQESLKGFLTNRFRFMVGTRSVVFVPLKPSIIIITGEHSYSYKQEEAPRVNARDVAVMRGFLEKIPVVLTSLTPSSESYLNCVKGKYRLISSSLKKPTPRLQIINTRRQNEMAPNLTKPVLEGMKKNLSEGVLAIIQRLGYSMIRCEDCYEVLTCPVCSRPLVLHKQEGLLCHHCGKKQALTDSCPNCGSHRLEFYGAGKERVVEAIESLIAPDGKLSKEALDETKQTIVVGTFSKRGLRRSRFSLIAFLNPDIMLNQPDIKSTERLLQEVFSFRELLNDNGTLQIQTSYPWHPVFKYLKTWDYLSFVRHQLSERKKLKLPPFVKTILIEVLSKKQEELKKLKALLSDKDIPTVGPLKVIRRKKEVSLVKIIIMKESIKEAREVAKEIIDHLEKRALSYRVDVEPVKIGY